MPIVSGWRSGKKQSSGTQFKIAPLKKIRTILALPILCLQRSSSLIAFLHTNIYLRELYFYRSHQQIGMYPFIHRFLSSIELIFFSRLIIVRSSISLLCSLISVSTFSAFSLCQWVPLLLLYTCDLFYNAYGSSPDRECKENYFLIPEFWN